MRILNDLTAKTTKIESTKAERAKFDAVLLAVRDLRDSHPDKAFAALCGEAFEKLTAVDERITSDAEKT